ncbi:MAG: DUF4438 family protein [Longimicrobiales bacterium]
MKTRILLGAAFLLFFVTLQATGQVRTNKDRLLTIAVRGTVAPSHIPNFYQTTWDGKAKVALGIGGINYELKLGENVFGWAAADRATMGVAAIGDQTSWNTFASVGNEVTILGGDAKGDTGVVIGKFADYVLLHFEDETLDKLTIGAALQVKASGIGLAFDGYDDVFIRGISAETVERIDIEEDDGRLEFPVVKEIPADLISHGHGKNVHYGNWNIQTSYAPDIEKYGLDELRFGDLVFLKDVQADYGRGYYKGGATIGIICSSPSDLSGMGIGVTPIISSRFDRLAFRIDPTANIAKYLGIEIDASHNDGLNGGDANSGNSAVLLRTNKDRLITTAALARVTPMGDRDYSPDYDGTPNVRFGSGTINYTVTVGDSAYGWANADHVEPDVSSSDVNPPDLSFLACIGNEATVITGDAKGAKGFVIGKHGSTMLWFPKDVLGQLSVDDRFQVRARGIGLKIDGFEDVRVNKVSPDLLENLGIEIDGGRLLVPVAKRVPGRIMGSGVGLASNSYIIEGADYDIQTTDPTTVNEYDLKSIRLGDIVAIEDHYDYWGKGRYEGAVTIGVIIHGFSHHAGHGPGVNPILSALPGRIELIDDPNANIAYYLGIRQRPAR